MLDRQLRYIAADRQFIRLFIFSRRLFRLWRSVNRERIEFLRRLHRQVLLHQLEKEHFGRAEGNSEDMLLACDLLVLDDLGAEFSSPFYVSCLYNLINTRMLEGRTIILSTNLNQNQLKERYGDQITSRITGTFVPLLFMGRDIRQQKRQEKL